ncbi:S1C family serine protease [Paenibacillus protaetiae]|uniref:PDZ domain-containing protein n=1 Tax=Paenibacillus protaetiae TaxID=2509456 RepID=A0A4P6F335_9BACL|nr:trypsin-like peptidase domain-containing protein [Paenibacillus protaetiae]QAY67527.1 PDZ domain-containing protein [Paenibacillus protaetiae]
MSLFKDDFYSTKVSKRARTRLSRNEDLFPKRSKGQKQQPNWSNIRIAFVSSLISSVAVVLIFIAVFGTFGSSRSGGSPHVASGAASADPSERTVQASAKVGPAVVSVINEQTALDGNKDGSAKQPSMEEAGVGSGIIFKKQDGKAYIMTNYHVVQGAEKVQVVLDTNEKREAQIVGMDQITDLAVLSLDAQGIDTVAEMGDSSKLRPAEYVLAIGNALGLGESLSMGIVSKTQQMVPVSLNQDGHIDWEQEVIQVDASINQGNSGGPLIDLDGRVVGINSMKISDFGVEGIGFAIPINVAMPIVETLMEKGYVPRPYLGVYTLDLDQYADQADSSDAKGADGKDTLKLPDEVYSGVIVLEAVGPAKDAGLKYNDVIVKLDGKPIGSTKELRQYLYGSKKIGDSIEVTYYRDGKEKTVSYTLGENTGEDD